MSVDAMEPTETPAGAATAAIPRRIRELFGEPPLLRSESRDAYDTLRSALAVQFDPREIMEWAWVRDLTDVTWDVATLPPEHQVLAESRTSVPFRCHHARRRMIQYSHAVQ